MSDKNTPVITPEVIAGILSAFFAAMMAGYASVTKPEKHTVSEFPGSKLIEFKYGEYTVKDCWHVTPISDYSFGQTIIYHKDVPVWMMSYEGWYKPEVIYFLKEALQENYSRKIFMGGRGPETHTYGNWQYHNIQGGDPGFSDHDDFEGFEYIIDTRTNKPLGGTQLPRRNAPELRTHLNIRCSSEKVQAKTQTEMSGFFFFTFLDFYFILLGCCTW